MHYSNQYFTYTTLKSGVIYQESNDNNKITVSGFLYEETFFQEENCAHYIYCYETSCLIFLEDQTIIPLRPGSYVQTSKDFSIKGKGIVITTLNHNLPTVIGYELEPKGRLKYIDGCSDNLLLPPVKKGNSCLNALYFPSGINQTMHTHPSLRAGLVAKGSGTCITPDGEVDLEEGNVWIIHTNKEHKFKTSLDEELVVVAFHPDSDFGPEDENHPMINRTIVDGVSASLLPNIHTKEI